MIELPQNRKWRNPQTDQSEVMPPILINPMHVVAMHFGDGGLEWGHLVVETASGTFNGYFGSSAEVLAARERFARMVDDQNFDGGPL